MTDYEKLKAEHSKLLGEFIGLLEGLAWWDLPEDLKKKIKVKKRELIDRIED
jgi:hypothetical protein